MTEALMNIFGFFRKVFSERASYWAANTLAALEWIVHNIKTFTKILLAVFSLCALASLLVVFLAAPNDISTISANDISTAHDTP